MVAAELLRRAQQLAVAVWSGHSSERKTWQVSGGVYDAPHGRETRSAVCVESVCESLTVRWLKPGVPEQ